MRTMLAISLGLFALSACGSAEGQSAPAREPAADPKAAPPPSRGPEGPVIVELFTSQGCSSCPPADKVLASLAKAGQLSGRAVAPLSFHVDYWNDLGWIDPFSQPAWTDRQRAYAGALGDRSVYTPQTVVGGATGMVGSHGGKVTAAIAAAERPALLDATAAWDKGSLEVTATAPAGAEVLVAVWEESRTVAVPRGENAGEKLTHHRIVRRLERIAGPGQRGTKRIALDPAWQAGGAVAFAQRADRKIVASALLPR